MSGPDKSSATSKPEYREELASRVGLRFGEWQVGEILGVGGMACVYAADNGLGDEAAIKIMHPEMVANVEGVERFHREATILERLAGHRSSLRFYGAGSTDEGHPFMVIERLRGRDLAQVRKQLGKRFPVEEAVRICEPVLDLLDDCHRLEIVHRDLKPSNIFICDDGTVKVLDFGVARLRSVREAVSTPQAPLLPLDMATAKAQVSAEHTRVGTAVGTAAYMAPEQAIGRSDLTDGRADVFAVGAMLYHLVSGAQVRHGTRFEEVFVQAATSQAPSLARVASDLSPAFIHAVDKALAWDPRARYQSAREMRDALLDALRHRTSAAEVGANLGGTLPVPLAELAHDVEAAPVEQDEALVALREVLRAMEGAMTTARRYGWPHTESEKRFQTCAGLVERALRNSEGLEWQVKPTCFMQGSDLLWEPSAAFESVPYNLFAAGIHYLRLTPGLTTTELRQLLAFLMQDSGQDAGSDEDLGVRLWEMGWEHIQFQLVSGFEFVETDAPEGSEPDAAEDPGSVAAETRELTRLLLASGRDAMAEASAMQVGLVPVLQRGAAPSLYAPLSDEARAAFTDRLSGGLEEVERMADVLLRALQNGRKAKDHERLGPFLDDLVPSYLQTGDPESLFRLVLATLEPLSAEPDLKAFFLSRALDRGRTARFLDAVATLTRSEATSDLDVPRMLALLGPAGFEAVLSLAPRTTGILFEHLVAYLFEHAAGFEAPLGAAFANASPEFAAILLRILKANPSEATREPVRQALEHPDLELRLAALGLLIELSPSKVSADVTRYFAHADPGVRIRVLRLLGPVKDAALVGPLEQRVASADFENLPNVERRLLLETLQGLAAPRAEVALLQILTQKDSLARGAAQLNNKMLALQLLAAWGQSARARDVLDEVAQARWGNHPEVRRRAQLAADAVRARLTPRAP